MSIAIGGDSVGKMYVGSTEITKAYIGDTLVYGGGQPPVVKNYLKFTALESGTFTLTIDALVTSEILQSVSYSVDNGATWVTTNNSSNAVTITTPTVQAGGSVLWKGLGIGTSYSYADNSKSAFSSTGTFNVSGNLLSLLYGDNFENYTAFDSGAYGTPNLFKGCTTIIDASELILPSGLVERCFHQMFDECSGLTSAPSLTAMTLANYCYYRMFRHCTSLTEAPELPATTLAGYCYYTMFGACLSLTSAPSLPSTSLAPYCYVTMFSGCSSLTNAPALPATTLASNCYQGMFMSCTSLVTAPVLPATTLVANCYRQMFYNCSNLTHVKAMFTTTPGSSYTLNWMRNVSSSGTFVKNASATWNVSGYNGIPSGWTVQTASS